MAFKTLHRPPNHPKTIETQSTITQKPTNTYGFNTILIRFIWVLDWVLEGSLAGICWVGFWGLGGPGGR